MNRLMLLGRALYSGITYGPYKDQIANPTTILIVQLQKLGDMVCTTPVFRAIKEKYPRSQITVLGIKSNESILRHNKDVAHFIPWNSISNLLKVLKNTKFEVAILIGPNFPALALLMMLRIKTIIAPKVVGGFCPWETRGYKLLRRWVVTQPHYMNQYAPREYLRLLEPINIVTKATKKFVYTSKDEEETAISVLSKHTAPFIALTPSAGNKVKEWGVDNFKQVIEYLLLNTKATVVLCGGPHDVSLVDQLLTTFKQTDRIINTAGTLSVGELTALIRHCELFVSVDTGPVYIAEALGIKTVDIIGPVSEVEQPPVGPNNRVVYLKDRKAPELHIMNARVYNAKEAKRQIDCISPDMVIAAIKDLLA